MDDEHLGLLRPYMWSGPSLLGDVSTTTNMTVHGRLFLLLPLVGFPTGFTPGFNRNIHLGYTFNQHKPRCGWSPLAGRARSRPADQLLPHSVVTIGRI